jgi:predicted nucleic acid-binding protein
MAGSGKCVVDASVVLAWLLPDEKVQDGVDELFSKMTRGEIDFVAPVLLIYEVWSGIRNAVLRKRIKKQIAEKLLERFAEMRIEYVWPDGKGIGEVDTAVQQSLSVYDAVYVTLAKRLNLELMTADKEIM